MNTIQDQLVLEEQNLQKQVRFLKNRINSYPDGILEISYCKGHVQYYRRPCAESSGRQKRTYIRKGNLDIAEGLAQRDYDCRLLKELQNRLRIVRRAREVYERTAPEDAALTFTRERQKLIKPLIVTDEQFAHEWMAEKYEKKPFTENSPEIITVRGERVRSKSEKIIADTLERYGIPYKYERPISLFEGLTVYPDFTVLNLKKREEYIWEHLGMMDNEIYFDNTAAKINSYIKSGYFPGDRLIITMESSHTPLSTRIIEMVIEKYLV